MGRESYVGLKVGGGTRRGCLVPHEREPRDLGPGKSSGWPLNLWSRPSMRPEGGETRRALVHVLDQQDKDDANKDKSRGNGEGKEIRASVHDDDRGQHGA